MSLLMPRNVVVNGHRTSFRLEPEIWSALDEIAAARRCDVRQLISAIDHIETRHSLSSRVRVWVLEWYRTGGKPRLDEAP